MPNRWFSNWGQVVQVICILIGTPLAIVKSYPDFRNDQFFTAGTVLLYTLLTVIAVMFVIWIKAAISPRIKPQTHNYTEGTLTRVERVVLDHLLDRCEALLGAYRRLDYDDRESSRLPFSGSSWPSYGMEWKYIHAELYSLCQHMDLFSVELRDVWNAFGWKGNPPIPNTTPSTVMVDYLNDMEKLADSLKQKSAEYGTMEA